MRSSIGTPFARTAAVSASMPVTGTTGYKNTPNALLGSDADFGSVSAAEHSSLAKCLPAENPSHLHEGINPHAPGKLVVLARNTTDFRKEALLPPHPDVTFRH